jgi:3-hydroxybutyryl-CoA dehydrogenase
VTLVDIDGEALELAVRQVSRGLRLSRFSGGASREPADSVLARVAATTDYGQLAGADFVIENVTEDWQVKRKVYHKLDDVCAGDVVLAANTSCIPITRIAGETRRPSQVIGMHFMNPVPLKPTVELIRADQTSPATVRRAQALLAQMGKGSIAVGDSPGFVANRVLMLAVNEAAYLVDEGIADASTVDQIFTSCVGHKMGLLETADLIGLDTVLRSTEVLHESFGGSKFRPCPLLRRLVEAGHLGMKTGQGFHSYPRRREFGKE